MMNDNNDAMLKFKSQELANLVWSFATVNCRIPGLMDSIAPYIISTCWNKQKNEVDVSRIAQTFKRQELANIAWSCAVLEQYPDQLLPLLYKGLIGNGDLASCNELKKLYQDDGLQKQAIMSLFYVQTTVDREASHIDIQLPPNFPDGWGENENEDASSNKRSFSKRAMDEKSTSTSMLELNTSRLQHDVRYEKLLFQ